MQHRSHKLKLDSIEKAVGSGKRTEKKQNVIVKLHTFFKNFFGVAYNVIV